MGLFSLNNILLESDNTYNKSINIDDIGYMDEVIREVSFVQEGYDAILEMNAYYCNAEKEFFYRIRESAGDNFIINEGFSDFFNKIKAIIKKFIDWVKKVFKEFAAKLAALVQSEKYIKKHKDLLNKFNSEDEFEFQGYKFTEITGSSIPLSNAVDAFNAKNGQGGFMPTVNLGNIFKGDSTGDYYKFTKDASAGTADLDAWDIADDEGNRDTELTRRKKATEKINQTLSDEISDMTNKNEDFYDEFRAYVLNQSGKKLDSKEFSDECFKVFRNGEDSTESITIDYNFVQDSYRNFDKYKDTIKDIEKKKNEMIKDYEDLEKHLDKLIKYNKETHKMEADKVVGRDFTKGSLNNLDLAGPTGLIYDSSTTDRLQSLMKVYSARVNQMCQIHTQAFSAKLEAAKDCFKQDKQILNKAIQQILKRSNKEGF